MLNDAYISVNSLRKDFESLKSTAVDLAENWKCSTLFSEKKGPKRHFDELSQHYHIENDKDYFRVNVFNRTLDIMSTQLHGRCTGLRNIVHDFRIVSPAFLQDSADDDIFSAGQRFCSKYEDDVSGTISGQLLCFKASFTNDLEMINSAKEILVFILTRNYSLSSSFSEIFTACCLFLTIPVTVAKAERSFSKLKIIKNYVRNTMGQERLSSLAIISIENDKAKKVDIRNLVTAFANDKFIIIIKTM